MSAPYSRLRNAIWEYLDSVWQRIQEHETALDSAQLSDARKLLVQARCHTLEMEAERLTSVMDDFPAELADELADA